MKKNPFFLKRLLEPQRTKQTNIWLQDQTMYISQWIK